MNIINIINTVNIVNIVNIGNIVNIVNSVNSVNIINITLKAENRATHTGHRRECGHPPVPQQNHDWATGVSKRKDSTQNSNSGRHTGFTKSVSRSDQGTHTGRTRPCGH